MLGEPVGVEEGMSGVSGNVERYVYRRQFFILSLFVILYVFFSNITTIILPCNHNIRPHYIEVTMLHNYQTESYVYCTYSKITNTVLLRGFVYVIDISG